MPFKAILAVESEIGRKGGGSQGQLLKNVIEDFAKLLVLQSEYKVLIFTSIPYVHDKKNYIEERLMGEFNKVYENAGHSGDILLIHLYSISKKSKNGNTTNPQVILDSSMMTAYVLSKRMGVQKLT